MLKSTQFWTLKAQAQGHRGYKGGLDQSTYAGVGMEQLVAPTNHSCSYKAWSALKKRPSGQSGEGRVESLAKKLHVQNVE